MTLNYGTIEIYISYGIPDGKWYYTWNFENLFKKALAYRNVEKLQTKEVQESQKYKNLQTSTNVKSIAIQLGKIR